MFRSSPVEDEELDPRIQVWCLISQVKFENCIDAYCLTLKIELEKLNSTTDEINRLETELDVHLILFILSLVNWKIPKVILHSQEANAGFRLLLNRSTQQLKALAKKLGSCIDKSRPYYDALEEYKVCMLSILLHFFSRMFRGTEF